jgi:hypothetical protein
MTKKHNIVIRMGATHWDARIRHNGEVIQFDFHKMDKKERSAFHRELMNAWRAQRKAA